jgi:hypothetical protein
LNKCNISTESFSFEIKEMFAHEKAAARRAGSGSGTA